MDILQIALVFLILLLAILLSILGIQVFLILKDLKKSLDKIDLILGDARNIAEDIKKPIQAVASVASNVENGVRAVETGMRVVQGLVKKKKSEQRLFKRKSG